jgi:hypothetical protein
VDKVTDGDNGGAIKFTLEALEARPGETRWQVATRLGTEIHLCYSPGPAIS